MKDLIIIGAGGFGREVEWLVERINSVAPSWNMLGFLDDGLEKGKQVGKSKVIGYVCDANSFQNACFVCAIANAKTRREIVKSIKEFNLRYATLIDPSVIFSDSISIGKGSIICAGSILTVDINIGEHVIINSDCYVGHDAYLSKFVTLYPSVNISGKTKLGRCVEMGTGSQIIQGLTVGENTIVGAGAVVVRDLPGDCTAVGVPARTLNNANSKNNGGAKLNV